MNRYRCMRLLWFLTILTPAVCQSSLLALDVGRDIISYPNYLYRSPWPYVNVTVGTPSQSMQMLVNVNLGDIIVVNKTSSDCSARSRKQGACSWGTFDVDNSSTLNYEDANFTGQAFDGADAVALDVVTVAGMPFQNMTIVIADDYIVPVFGIGGYPDQEGLTPLYSNVPLQLYQNGNTSISGFSLYLPHNNDTTLGRLVFGGVETTKFWGYVETLQIVLDSGSLSYSNMTVMLANMSTSGSTGDTMIDGLENVELVLSTAVPGMGLLNETLTQVLDSLNLTAAQSLTSTQFPNDPYGILSPYDSVDNDSTINLQLGSTWISIPIWDMMVPYNASHAFIGIYAVESFSGSIPVIGGSFFSNAYSIFDFTHNQISIAPLRYEALSDDDITPIDPTGATGLLGYQPPAGLSTGAKVGIGVGAAFGVVIVGLAAVWFVLGLRRSRKAHMMNTKETKEPEEDDKEQETETTVLSTYFSDKSELHADSREVDHERSSPLLERQLSPPAEIDGVQRQEDPSVDRGPTIVRKPVAPQELP